MHTTCDYCGKQIDDLAYQKETKHFVKPGCRPAFQFCNEQCANGYQWHYLEICPYCNSDAQDDL